MLEALVHPLVTSTYTEAKTFVAVQMDAAGIIVEVTRLQRIVLVELLVVNGHTAAN